MAAAHQKHPRSTWDRTTLVAVLLSSLLAGGAYGAQNIIFDHSRFAVVRPFSAHDIDSLSTSFDTWNEFSPCTTMNKEHPSPPTDLFLVYSQSYESSPEAQKAVDAVTTKFSETDGWGNCFANVVAIEVDVDADLDLYEPSQQNDNDMWVNGPNRQFERTIRKIQTGEWGTYESMFLMESDVVPVKTLWLDTLLSQVEQNRPFAILGSKYTGDKWDSFYAELPSSLVDHINGNAIYNVTHPLLNEIVSQLEEEATAPHNAVPYDYRISQINEAKASQWQDEDLIKETKAIANYAATNILPDHIGEEVLMHGANVYQPWDSEEEITLVVSDWNDEQSAYLLSHLDDGEHPFSNIVLMLPSDTPTPDLNDQSPSTPVTVHNRYHSEPDYMDICTAPVTTKWFMLTNSYHRLMPNLSLMTTSEGKPVIPFAPATEEYCYKFPSCKDSMAYARSIYPSQDTVVQDYDMIYSTDERNDMCKLWMETYGTDGRRRLANLDNAEKAAIPTATAYAAYLNIKGRTNELYSFSDRTKYGARDAFAQVYPYPSSDDEYPDTNHGNRRLLEASSSNSTGCQLLVTRDECLDSALECDWRTNFDSCHASNIATTDYYYLSMTLDGVGELSSDAMSDWENVTSYHVASYYDLTNGAQDVETEIISQSSAKSTTPSGRRMSGVTNKISYKQRLTSASAVTEVAEATASAEEALTAPFSEEAAVASYVTLLQESGSAVGENNAFSDVATVGNVKIIALSSPKNGDEFTPSNGMRRKGLIALIAGIAGGAVVLTALVAAFLWRKSRSSQQEDMIYDIDSSIESNTGNGGDDEWSQVDGGELMQTVALGAGAEYDHSL